jgi:hypothetical protein
VPHSRTNWMFLFVVMIILSVVAALYAFRGLRQSLRALIRRNTD